MDAPPNPIPRCVASLSPGLPVRLRRPSVAPSARSRDGGLRDCDHADGTPAASFVAWRGAPERCTARVARHAIVRCPTRGRRGVAGTMASPARPDERQKPAGSGATPARPFEAQTRWPLRERGMGAWLSFRREKVPGIPSHRFPSHPGLPRACAPLPSRRRSVNAIVIGWRLRWFR